MLWLANAAPGQTLQVISSNGPSASRYELVFLSEGYTSAQIAQFRTDATNAANSLFSRQPFAEYSSYFNVYAISVASTQSGSDHPSYPLSKDTYFSSTYDLSDRIITIPAGTKGQAKVDALLNTYVPGCDLVILLVNDPVSGGSDGSQQVAICSVAGIADVLVHECGHVIAGLGDEYTTANASYPDVEEPNTTRETNRVNIKWKTWIADFTPVPTPGTSDYDGVIGLFEGAHYHSTGWYRPKLNCTMQSQSTPEFCEVCREALVLALYGQVRPTTSVLPAQAKLFPASAAPITFGLNSLQPATHNLQIEWTVNGMPLIGASSINITLYPAVLPAGTNVVRAIVADKTPYVRTDPSSLLRQTNSWSLRNDLPYSPPLLTLVSPNALTDRFTFSMSGTALQAIIEGSTNLVDWTALSTNALVNGAVQCSFENRASEWLFRASAMGTR